jgi:hypothetical protein
MKAFERTVNDQRANLHEPIELVELGLLVP